MTQPPENWQAVAMAVEAELDRLTDLLIGWANDMQWAIDHDLYWHFRAAMDQMERWGRGGE